LAVGERTLILAEGFSADHHYGKTMRGVLRYRRQDVVAILDSARAGESEEGVPIVGDVTGALPYEPQVALVGVATQGGRFPPPWRAILVDCIEAGLSMMYCRRIPPRFCAVAGAAIIRPIASMPAAASTTRRNVICSSRVPGCRGLLPSCRLRPQ